MSVCLPCTQSATRALHKAAMKLFIHCNYVQELVLNDRKCLQDGQFSLKASENSNSSSLTHFPVQDVWWKRARRYPRLGMIATSLSQESRGGQIPTHGALIQEVALGNLLQKEFRSSHKVSQGHTAQNSTLKPLAHVVTCEKFGAS